MTAGLVGGASVGFGELVDGMDELLNGGHDRWIDRWVNCCADR